MFSKLVSPLLLLALMSSEGSCDAGENENSPDVTQHSRWNYTYMNNECINSAGIRYPCKVSYTCNFTTESTVLRGRPIVCGWYRNGFPRICCRHPNMINTTPTEQKPPENRSCGRSMMKRNGSLSNVILTGLIMGGANASQGEFPWMVAINIRESQSTYIPHCTGFLIDAVHVLTAAHCFEESRDPVMFIVKIGDILLSRCTTYTIRRIVVHEGYVEGRFYNDIAVIILTTTVREKDFTPLCLPTQDIMRMNLTGRGMTVAGWGSERYRKQMTDHLKKVESMPTVSNLQCNRRLNRVYPTRFREEFPAGINNSFICAGFREGMHDPCEGDSGGPLMFQKDDTYYAVGLVSFGINCGRPETPGGYTRISTFIHWIRRKIRD